MRILLISQYFAPEITAASARLLPFAQGLAALGHEVEVLCEIPNHPDGVVRDGYGGRFSVRERAGDVAVRHVWVKATPEKTTLTRLLFYGTFAGSAVVAGSTGPKPDVVLSSSPPLPGAAAAALVAARHRVPLVLDIRDPWPEAAVALGELSNPRIIGLLERLERWLYRRAAAIVTVTEPFRTDIGGRSDPEKITIIPNGTTGDWMTAGEAEVDRSEMDMPEDRFVVTYAGNVGIAQGLDSALDAVASLDGVQLQIVGEGPVLGRLRERAASLPSGKVVFRGLVTPAEAARYLRASDANLVPLGAQKALEKFVPSKLFDCCAVGRPVLLAAAGEPMRLAGEAGAAVEVQPEDAASLASAIRRLRDDPGLCAELGEKGRAFAAGYLREDQVARLGAVLEAAVAGRRIS